MNDVPETNPTPVDFEAALKRLEEIVHSLEEGDVGLNQALERYEEGVKLLRQSYELLQRAERRIELLSGVDSEGNAITQPFEHSATFEQKDPGQQRSRRRSSSSKKPAAGGESQIPGCEDVDEASELP